MIRFVDLEASSLLPCSFPIEVAWVDQDGHGESYLVRPPPAWLEVEVAWSADSERVHGISLATLMAEGVPVERVATRMAEALAPAHVMACSDAPNFDGAWISSLLEAGGVRASVQLVHVRRLYALACRPLRDLLPLHDGVERESAELRIENLALEIIARAGQAEALRPRTHHRALPDAESLWRTWRAIRDEVSRRRAEESEQ
jgi:hypothetical protein